MRCNNTWATRFVLFVAICGFGLPPFVFATTPTADEMATARQWCAARFEDGGEGMPPFSFTCDGKPSAELLPHWKQTHSVRELDDRRSEHTLAWADPNSGLVVRCVAVVYRDFPVAEWTLYFKNRRSTTGACALRVLLIPACECVTVTHFELF